MSRRTPSARAVGAVERAGPQSYLRAAVAAASLRRPAAARILAVAPACAAANQAAPPSALAPYVAAAGTQAPQGGGQRAGRRAAGQLASGAVEAEDDEEEATDDEDSDDEERELFIERLPVDQSPEFIASLDAKAKDAPHLVCTAKSVPYQLVVPTYGRWQPVGQMTGKKRFKNSLTPFILAHTLGFLSRQQIPKKRVTLFVASQQEEKSYRKALQGSEWADVKIVISVLGNKNSRNFIYRYFPADTYVVSLDDDVEQISWKFRDGITHHVLRGLPPGCFERIIFEAHRSMREKNAYLWGVNTSQNPRHMRHWGSSIRNGLVNGYLNGFICRPRLSKELLRSFADATEDSEFSVRHFAKDGIVLRYRMYAGVTSPYMNRGGLQTKFEREGERITAEERSTARKAEERCGAMDLHRSFPRLIGVPRPRRDKKTMEVTFFPHGYPPGEGASRKIIDPNFRDDDCIAYNLNPKVVGSVSHGLYEGYKGATTVGDARRLGARPIDFGFDYNWGYLTVTKLCTRPESAECEVRVSEPATPIASSAPTPATGSHASKGIRVRVKEMSLGHKGLELPRRALTPLVSRCPALRSAWFDGSANERWAKDDGPFSRLSLSVFRILIHWASVGRLRYARRQTKAVHDALKRLGCMTTARAVKRLEAQELAVAARAGAVEKAPRVKANAPIRSTPGAALRRRSANDTAQARAQNKVSTSRLWRGAGTPVARERAVAKQFLPRVRTCGVAIRSQPPKRRLPSEAACRPGGAKRRR